MANTKTASEKVVKKTPSISKAKKEKLVNASTVKTKSNKKPVEEKTLKAKEEKVVKKVEKITKTTTKPATKPSATPKVAKPKQTKNTKPTVATKTPMKKILYVSSECQPFVATGGLADVAGSLPKFIAKEDNGIDIRVVLPLYECIADVYRKQMQFLGFTYVKLSWRNQYCGIFTLKDEGVTYYFIDNEYYFKRKNPYSYYDDAERFAFFSRAVLEMEKITKFNPDIVHANDWQSALSVIYLKTTYKFDARYTNTKAVFTIHNIEYQGKYGRELFGDVFDLPVDAFNIVDYEGCINLVKGAIQCCNMFTTVSPTYAKEIQTPQNSVGLHHIINKNAYKLKGILNGIDYDFYNPKTDKNLCVNYDLSNIQEKIKNKLFLQHELGLEPLQSVPMIAIISRLVNHKGIDLVKEIIEQALQQNRIQLVIVGTGEDGYVKYFKWLESRYPSKVRALVGQFDNILARKVYAASDILLMPSRFEPCGLSQMICSRYGVTPIVRETGGLKDSIKDFGCEGGGNGYTFKDYNPYDLLYSINRAVQDYFNPAKWKQQIEIIMRVDYSWQKSAKEYIQTYNQLN